RRADRRGGGGDGVPRGGGGHRHDLPRAPVAFRGDEGSRAGGGQAGPQHLTAGIGRLDGRAIALAVLCMAVLGGPYTPGQGALPDLPPFGLLASRMTITTAVLGCYAAFAGLSLRQPLGYVVAQTIVFALSQALLFVALGMTTAGRVAILFNTQPFFTLLLLP